MHKDVIVIKEEVLDALELIAEQQKLTNETFDNYIKKQSETVRESEKKEALRLEAEKKEAEENEDTEEDIEVLEEDTLLSNYEDLYEIYIQNANKHSENQETLITQNNEMIDLMTKSHKSNVEGNWAIVITLIVALGFHYFINQFSKW